MNPRRTRGTIHRPDRQRQACRGGGRAAPAARAVPPRSARPDRHARRAATPRPAAPARCTSTARPSSRAPCSRCRPTAPTSRRSRGWRRTASCTRCSRRSTRSTALQCGYCTPGMIMSAAYLLEQNPNPSEQEVRLGLEGNLCRCTGLSEHRQRRARRGQGVARWLPSMNVRHRRVGPAQGGRAADHRPGPLRRRHQAARHGATPRSLRSPHAHADITGIDTSAAEAMPGVVKVLHLRHARSRGRRALRLEPVRQRRRSPSGRSWPTARCAWSASRSRSSWPSRGRPRATRPIASSSTTTRCRS